MKEPQNQENALREALRAWMRDPCEKTRRAVAKALAQHYEAQNKNHPRR